MNMIEKVARALATKHYCKRFDRQSHEAYVIGNVNDNWNIFAEDVRTALEALRDPSDELLLAPGEPYRIQKAVYVSREEGIELRRKAWNKIIDAALKEKLK